MAFYPDGHGNGNNLEDDYDEYDKNDLDCCFGGGHSCGHGSIRCDGYCGEDSDDTGIKIWGRGDASGRGWASRNGDS